MSKEFPAYSVDQYMKDADDSQKEIGNANKYRSYSLLSNKELLILSFAVTTLATAYILPFAIEIKSSSVEYSKIVYSIFITCNIAAAAIASKGWKKIPSKSIAKDSTLLMTLSLCCAALGNSIDLIFWVTELSDFKQSIFTNIFFVFGIILAMPSTHMLGKVCRVKFGKQSIITTIIMFIVYISTLAVTVPKVNLKISPTHTKEFIFAIIYTLGIGYLAAISIQLWKQASGRLRDSAKLQAFGLILLSFGCSIYAGLFMSLPASQVASHPVHIIIAIGYLLTAFGINKTASTINLVFNIKIRDLPPALPLIEIFGPSLGMEVYQKMETRIKETFIKLLQAKAESEKKENTINELETEVELRKEIEKALTIEKERAEEANMAKSQFLAMMSHELKTPLTAVKGYGRLLSSSLELSKTPTPEKLKEISDQIVYNANNLQAMIDTLLQLSQLESGKLNLEIEAFKLKELKTFIESIVRQQKEFNNSTIITDISDKNCVILSNQQAIQHIIVNLFMNACKFCKSGTIFIKLECKEPDLLLKVSDTGIGILGNDLEKIFEIFYQVSRGNQRKYGGSGLGLSIVKKLIEELDGKIFVESEIGKCSKFSVVFPGVVRSDE